MRLPKFVNSPQSRGDFRVLKRSKEERRSECLSLTETPTSAILLKHCSGSRERDDIPK